MVVDVMDAQINILVMNYSVRIFHAKFFFFFYFGDRYCTLVLMDCFVFVIRACSSVFLKKLPFVY